MQYGVPGLTEAERSARCCKIGCLSERATWALVFGPAPDDTTESCDAHVAELLGDSPLLGITRLEETTPDYLDILFDGPPGPVAGRFVDVQGTYGAIGPAEVNPGKWIPPTDDRYWRLRIPVPSGCLYG